MHACMCVCVHVCQCAHVCLYIHCCVRVCVWTSVRACVSARMCLPAGCINPPVHIPFGAVQFPVSLHDTSAIRSPLGKLYPVAHV